VGPPGAVPAPADAPRADGREPGGDEPEPGAETDDERFLADRPPHHDRGV
jgi:hypothetical protein